MEVGIDVKTANLMIIYNANQFGLASLHQLRGRIGRDGQKACCFLVYDEDDEEEKEKLQVLEKTDDGFVVAEEDLKRRGPGEFIGYRQSGLPNFHYVNFINDFKIIEAAKKDALMILDDEYNPKYKNILKALKDALSINNSDLV